MRRPHAGWQWQLGSNGAYSRNAVGEVTRQHPTQSSRIDSAKLFVERAGRANPHFVLSKAESADVARTCPYRPRLPQGNRLPPAWIVLPGALSAAQEGSGWSERDRGRWALGIPALRQKKRRSRWPLCHNKRTALPMTLAPLIGPQDRLSHESDRLSPIT